MSVGLFGYDMAPLKSACRQTDLEICDSLDQIDGWSIGVEIIIDEE